MEVDFSSNVAGTCEDMCPPQERIKRQDESDVHHLEMPLPGQTLQQTMIKKFQRSSADHELQIAEAMRTPAALLRTVQYIEDHIMNDEDDPLRTYLFIWDRYRMIAKDFTLQASALPVTETWIECHERMVRWFVFMDHAMQVNGEFLIGHAQQNSERLNDFLKSLGHHYESPSLPESARKNQAEFLSYFMLLQIGNGGEVARHLYRLPTHLLQSPYITFVMHVWSAIRTKNFMRFFQLLNEANVLQASLMHRYLGAIRLTAIHALGRACSMGSKAFDMPLEDISDTLCFESFEETIEFLQHCGYTVDEDKEEALLDAHVPVSSFPHDKNDLPIYPKVQPMVNRIGGKAKQFTIQEICRGAATVFGDLISGADTDSNMDDERIVPLKPFVASSTKTASVNTVLGKPTVVVSVPTKPAPVYRPTTGPFSSKFVPPTLSSPVVAASSTNRASPVTVFLKAPAAPSPRPKYSPPPPKSSVRDPLNSGASMATEGLSPIIPEKTLSQSEKRKALLNRPLASDRSSTSNSPLPSSNSNSNKRKDNNDGPSSANGGSEKKKGSGELAARLAKAKQQKQQQELSVQSPEALFSPPQKQHQQNAQASGVTIDESSATKNATVKMPVTAAPAFGQANPFSFASTPSTHPTNALQKLPFGASAAIQPKPVMSFPVATAGNGLNVDAKAFFPSFAAFPPPSQASAATQQKALGLSFSLPPTATSGNHLFTPAPPTTTASANPFIVGDKMSSHTSPTAGVTFGVTAASSTTVPSSSNYTNPNRGVVGANASGPTWNLQSMGKTQSVQSVKETVPVVPSIPSRMTSSDRAISLTLQLKQALQQQQQEEDQAARAFAQEQERLRKAHEEATMRAHAEQEAMRKEAERLQKLQSEAAAKREQERRREQWLAQCAGRLQRQQLQRFWRLWWRLCVQRLGQKQNFVAGLSQLSVREAALSSSASAGHHHLYDINNLPTVPQHALPVTKNSFSSPGSSLFDVLVTSTSGNTPLTSTPTCLAETLTLATDSSNVVSQRQHFHRGGKSEHTSSPIVHKVGTAARVFQLRLLASSAPTFAPTDIVLETIRASLRNPQGWLSNFPNFVHDSSTEQQLSLAQLSLHFYRSGIIQSQNKNNLQLLVAFYPAEDSVTLDSVCVSVSELIVSPNNVTDALFVGPQLLLISSLDLLDRNNNIQENIHAKDTAYTSLNMQENYLGVTPMSLCFVLYTSQPVSATGTALHIPHYPTPESISQVLSQQMKTLNSTSIIEQELFSLCHAFQKQFTKNERILSALLRHTRHCVFLLVSRSSTTKDMMVSTSMSSFVSQSVASALHCAVTQPLSYPSIQLCHTLRMERNTSSMSCFVDIWRDLRLSVVDTRRLLPHLLARALPSTLSEDTQEVIFTVYTLAEFLQQALHRTMRNCILKMQELFEVEFHLFRVSKTAGVNDNVDEIHAFLQALSPPLACLQQEKGSLLSNYADFFQHVETQGKKNYQVFRVGCVSDPVSHNYCAISQLQSLLFDKWLPSLSVLDRWSNNQINEKDANEINWEADVSDWKVFRWISLLEQTAFPSIPLPKYNNSNNDESLTSFSFTHLLVQAVVEPSLEHLFGKGGVTTKFVQRHTLTVCQKFLLRRLSLVVSLATQESREEQERINSVLSMMLYKPYLISDGIPKDSIMEEDIKPETIQDHALLLYDEQTPVIDSRPQRANQRKRSLSKSFINPEPLLLTDKEMTDNETEDALSISDWVSSRHSASLKRSVRDLSLVIPEEAQRKKAKHPLSSLETIADASMIAQRDLMDTLQSLLQKEKQRSQLSQEYLSKQVLQG